MNTKAIIGQTEEVYHIDQVVLDFLNYTYIGEYEILVGVGFKYRREKIFQEVEVDGVLYDLNSLGLMPNPNSLTPRDIQQMGGVDKMTPYQVDVLSRLVDGTEICSVSEYKRNEKSYQRRLREKKLERIVKE